MPSIGSTQRGRVDDGSLVTRSPASHARGVTKRSAESHSCSRQRTFDRVRAERSSKFVDSMARAFALSPAPAISGRTLGRCGRSCRSRACASCREGERRDAHPLSHPLLTRKRNVGVAKLLCAQENPFHRALDPLLSRNRTAGSLSRYAPRRTRTPSLLIRSQALYPVELWARWAVLDSN